MSRIKTTHRRRQHRKANVTAFDPELAEELAQKPKKSSPNAQLKRFIVYLLWAYLLLLLFDGALRKWFLPGLSDLLLVSRIPLVGAIYLLAIPARVFTINGYILFTLILAAITSLLALASHGSIAVAVYGAMVNYFFIPLIFVIPRVLDYRETERMGRLLLFLVVPMTVLIGMQFYSPQNAWVNLSVGGVESEGFTGALGRFRPPGTFSFITGVAQFYTLAFAFFLNQFVQQRTIPIWLLTIIGPSFLMAIYGSISRLLALSVLLVFIFCVSGLIINGRKLHKAFKIILALLVFFVIASQFTYFRDGLETFTARWEQAIGEDKTAEEAVVDRTLGTLIDPLLNPQFSSIVGEGLGFGTNVGARLAVGQRAFLGGEGEWGRIMAELGPIFGYAYIGLRVALTVMLGLYAFRALLKGNLLPWLIFGSAIFLVISGQWGQQTTLGFAILSAGFVLSANNMRRPQGEISTPNKEIQKA